MKALTLVLLLAVVLAVSNESCPAQAWKQLSYIRYGSTATSIYNRATESLVGTPLVALKFGSHVFISEDSGATFHAVDIPIKRNFYGALGSIVASSNTIYIESWDAVGPKYTWIVRSTDRGISWSALEHNGDPYASEGVLIASGDFLALSKQRAGDSLYISQAYYSTDQGTTWGSETIKLEMEDPYFNDLINATEAPLFDEASAGCIYQLLPSGARETRDGGVTWTPSPVQKGTTRFWYLSPKVILALQADANGAVRCRKSIDSGATWMSMDSLRFVNSDTVVTVGHMQIVRQDSAESFTFRLLSGCVFSTTDHGTTWILRGFTPRNNSQECLFYSSAEQGSLCSAGDGRIYTVPLGSVAPLTSVRSPGTSPIPVGDSTLIARGRSALYKSTDRGQSWYGVDEELTGYSGVFKRDDPNIQPYEGRKLWWNPQRLLRALAQYDIPNYDSYKLETKHLLTWNSSLRASRWYATLNSSSINWLYLSLPISESNTRLVAGVSPSPWCVLIVDDWRPPYQKSVLLYNDASKNVTEHTRKDAHFVWSLKSGVLLIAADSLLRSVDSAVSFAAIASAGLPRRANGSLAVITSMCEDNSGTIYAGLSGRTIMTDSFIDSSIVELEPGGVWKSTNVGSTWTAVAGFPAQTHVLNIACDGAGTLYATTTQRTRSLVFSGSNQDQDDGADVYVVRGDTAEKIFSEFIAGPKPPGNRVLRRDQKGAMLCATMYSGLLRTTNAGREWTKVGGDELDTVTINDVVIGRDNELYIGTTKGVMYSNAIVTSVEQTHGDDEDQSRRTTVWCYPTPTKQSLRIRLNNMDLVQGIKPRLTLVTLMGEEVMNLTDQAAQSLGSRRTEFDVDVSGLSRGVYGLALQAGKNSSFFKVFVVR